MKTMYGCIIALTIAVSAWGQSSPKETVENYFKGYKAGNKELLKTVFHPDFRLSWISPWGSGTAAYQQVDREGLFGFFGPDWKNLKISASMSDLQVTGNAAVCKATIKIEGMVTWTDYISMLKINGRWWIVSKISDGKLP